MAYPRFQRARDFKFFNRTAGDLTLNSTVWADLPTIGTTWDATLAAQVGDVIEAGMTGVWNTDVVFSYLDAVTVVGGAVVNHFGTSAASGSGVESWRGNTSSQFDPIGGSIYYALVAGDISAGTVTVRPRFRTSAAINKVLYASSLNPLQWRVRNLGPADPN